MAACVHESKGMGMKDMRDDSGNDVSYSAEQPEMRRIAVGYFPFTPIAFSWAPVTENRSPYLLLIQTSPFLPPGQLTLKAVRPPLASEAGPASLRGSSR